VRSLLGFVALTLAFAAGTLIGWWMVPATAALWGALRPSIGRPAFVAALASALAWACWLVVDVIVGNGTFGVLAARLAGVMQVPAVGLVALTLVFAGLLAWSAAVLGLGTGYWVLGTSK
jgi:hypothetical protein